MPALGQEAGGWHAPSPFGHIDRCLCPDGRRNPLAQGLPPIWLTISSWERPCCVLVVGDEF